MYHKTISNDHLVLNHCFDRYKTQEMCDKAVDDFLPASKHVLGCFVTSKTITKLDELLFANDDTLFLHDDTHNVTFFSDEMSINRS